MIQSEIACRRKLIEVGIEFQRRLGFCSSLLKLLVLHLEFDLVNLQFLNESLRVVSRSFSSSYLALALMLLV